MGAVITNDFEKTDTANLLPPEGREFGAARASEINAHLNALEEASLMAYMREVREVGGVFKPFGHDFAVGFRAAVPTEFFPRHLVAQIGGALPDFYSNFGFFIVSENFKTLVDEFDGEMHQFVPVEITDKSGAAYSDKRYYYFKCRQVLNAIDDTSETINIVKTPSAGPETPFPFTFTFGTKFRMFSEQIGHSGIWQELRCLRSFFVSEAFLAEMQRRQLTGIRRCTDFAEV